MSQSEAPAEDSPSRQALPPALAHIRPTIPSEMLDRLTQLAIMRWRLVLPLAALMALPEPLIAAILTLFEEHVPETAASGRVQAILVALAIFLPMWPKAAILLSAFHAYLFPRQSLRVRSAFRASFVRLPYLILTELYIWMFYLVMLFPAIMLSQAPGAISLIISALVGISAVAVFAGLWFLVPVIVMVEHKSFFRAMGRSMELMTSSFGEKRLTGDSPLRRLLALIVFPAVIFAVEMAIVQVTGMLLATPAVTRTVPTWAIVAAGGSLHFLLGTVLTLWLSLGRVLLYAECRMRREGMDLHVRLLARTDSETTPVLYRQD